MESITYLKNVTIQPKKLRFFMAQIKQLSPDKALEILKYTPNRPARVFYKAIQSAIANAKLALKVESDLLKFKTLIVEEGQKLKRYNPGSRGTAKPYVHQFSHIKIILDAPAQKAQITESKPAVKKENKKEVVEAQSKVKVEKEKKVKKTAVKKVEKKS